MALARWQETIVDLKGNVIDQPTIEVRREVSGQPLALLYSDREGDTPLGNPFTPVPGSNGFASFHVRGGAYQITVTKGAYSKVHRYVGIGTASETDIAVMTPRGDWSSIVTFQTGDVVNHEGYLFASLIDDNLNIEPDTSPATTAEWMSVPGGEGPPGPQGDPGEDGDDGAPGAAGAPGATGPNTGLDYAWATATSGDPGSGKLLANHATLSSATVVNISKTDRSGASKGAFIGTWDDSTNTPHKGHLRIFTLADHTEFIEAAVTAIADQTTYWAVSITVESAAGSPSLNDVMCVMFERTGDKGADGGGSGDVSAASNFGTDNRLIRSDGTTKGVQASAVTVDDSGNISGVGTLTVSGVIAGVGAPSNASDAANKSYVDSLVAVGVRRGTVRAATTANITISTALNSGDTIDGVTLADGDLVLVKNQSTASQNGVYEVANSPARATQFDTYNEHPGAMLAVQEGTANADTLWLCTSNLGGTLGSTAIAFTSVAIVVDATESVSGKVELATAAETATGSDNSRAVHPAGAAAVYSPITRQVNAQTGTTYTFVLADAGKLVTLTNSSPVTATVPPNSDVAFPIYTQIDVAAIGAGQVTLAQGSGVTIASEDSKKKLTKRYSTGTLIKIATDTWLLAGSIAT